jgi:hypothetical protein
VGISDAKGFHEPLAGSVSGTVVHDNDFLLHLRERLYNPSENLFNVGAFIVARDDDRKLHPNFTSKAQMMPLSSALTDNDDVGRRASNP